MIRYLKDSIDFLLVIKCFKIISCQVQLLINYACFSDQIKPALITELGDKNWKVRGEALQKVTNFFVLNVLHVYGHPVIMERS